MLSEARTQLRTLRDLLRYAVSRFGEAKLFFGHGSGSAYDEAAYLILHTLHLPLDLLDPFLDAKLTDSEINSVVQIVERRVRLRVPAAYLTQEAWLGDFKFYVDERVIVPRSYIAELLREQLQPWIDKPDSVKSVLELCTGSGCLAVLAAHAFPNAHVDAVDISEDALAVAKRNVGDYDLNKRVQLHQSDLFGAVEGKRYDLIIANPPYVNKEGMLSLPKEYRHEPELALDGGEDGLTCVRSILRQARGYLNRGGNLVIELGHNKKALEAAYPDTDFTWLTTSAGDDLVFLLSQDQLS